MWTPLTAEGVEVLGLAVYQCLQRWTALQLAICNEWGGSSSARKCQQFHADILSFFTHSKERRYIDELEDLLDQFMLESFNTEIEDGSLFEVAEQIMTIHEECMLGNFENVRRMATPGSESGQSVLDSKQVSTAGDDVENSTGNHQLDMAGEEAESMITEDSVPAAVPSSSSTSRTDQKPLLTEEEMANGWQEVPMRKGRRHRT